MKNLLLIPFVILFCSDHLKSQENADIGLSVSTFNNNLHILNLEYRNPLNEKWKINFGLTSGVISNFPFTSELWAVTDSVITYRHYSDNFYAVSLRTGLERKIKTSFFSYGINLALGYGNYKQSKFNYEEVYDTLFSPYIFPVETRPGNSDLAAYQSTNYLQTALQFSLRANIPLNERLLFSVFGIYSGDFSFKTNTVKLIDPLLDMPQAPDFGFATSFNIGFGLRYVLGLKSKNNYQNNSTH